MQRKRYMYTCVYTLITLIRHPPLPTCAYHCHASTFRAQVMRKRIEEKREKKLENQRKAEVVQKVKCFMAHICTHEVYRSVYTVEWIGCIILQGM